jgi:N6-L-threonylcarbamoyladenine synthase
MPTVLAIETSCDETAVAIVKKRNVLSSIVSSQIETHRLYGGVVPEVASRQHLETIGGVIAAAIDEAAIGWEAIDGIGVTCTPGLVGALMVGLTAAKTLAVLHDKPLLGVHHLEGHIYASYLAEPTLEPPFLCLLVSGGHTSLIHVRDCGDYEIVGQTRDDAAGEAFDKVARLLELGYPGGPVIDRVAREGDATAFKLPEGRVKLADGGGFHPYDSSFSGLKTAVRRLVDGLRTERGIEVNDTASLPVADIAASFQEAVARALTKRAIRCATDLGLTTIALGGGVAANSRLRSCLQAAAQDTGIKVLFPPMQFCTDNAAMIGCAAAEHLARGHVSPLTLGVRSRLPLSQVRSLYELD